jgi:hypothetical protein
MEHCGQQSGAGLAVILCGFYELASMQVVQVNLLSPAFPERNYSPGSGIP